MSSKLLIAQIPPFDLLEAFALQLNGHDGRINSMQYVKSKCRSVATTSIALARARWFVLIVDQMPGN